ncbi:substrate-binding domain-containing protein [Streptomyces sp. NPDC048278]|uniref:substrate-binding domain-containing protein n=1 Tax=Streptomyces sp. NPDC048278 TaxID=3155809 RepID=UPI0034456E03
MEIGRPPHETVFDAMHTADDVGARLAVDHLVSLGHQDIVHVDGGEQPGAAERRAGYLDAMRRHGLGGRARVVPGDCTERSGSEAARSLLAAGALPTAVVAGNDQCAIGLLVELRHAGVDVPGRVSIVGYDDSRLARLATSTSPPCDRMPSNWPGSPSGPPSNGWTANRALRQGSSASPPPPCRARRDRTGALTSEGGAIS